MKKIIFILALLLLINSISVSALRVGNIRYTDEFFLINVHNSGEDLEDLKIKVMVMDNDINVYNSKTFDLDKGETRGTYIIIDEPVTEGIVKITVRNDDVRRVKYIII